MTTDHIYTLVNSVAAQSTGHSGIVATDTSSLVALGNTVLSSSTNTEAFINTLLQRIGRTIIDFRRYRNKLSDMVLNDFEYGMILQKVKVVMPEAVDDPTYDLVDGSSIDPWTVYKPTAVQKLFVKRTPYMFAQTISRQALKEAFTSADAMGQFIAAVMGEMRNAVELSLENLGRLTICNMIAETASQVDLVTEWNNMGGSLTAATALLDKDFLAYAIRRINEILDGIQALSELYNDGTVARFTPEEDVRVKLISPFVRAAETVVQYAAFNEELIRVDNRYLKVPYWQDAQDPMEINVDRASDSAATNIQNIIGVVHDREACGMYRIEEEVNTTPLNAKGRYYTTYMHEEQLWFNDLSENFVVFTLN